MKKIFKKSITKRFRKYRVSILNEFTLEEVFFFRISKGGFYVLLVLIFVFLFVLFSLLYNYTPFKRFSPGYSDMVVRSELVQETIRLDSLSNIVAMQRKQLDILRTILSGEVSVDSVFTVQNVVNSIVPDSAVKSKKEQEFCAAYEEKERFNLSSIKTPKQNNNPFFVKPIRRKVTREFDLSKNHIGCDIMYYNNENVVSVYAGVVIFAEYTVNAEYVIGILHENDFISVYKYNSELLKKIGDEVKTGEVIAIVNSPAEKSTKPYIHFELWQKGKPLNPTEYIIF